QKCFSGGPAIDGKSSAGLPRTAGLRQFQDQTDRFVRQNRPLKLRLAHFSNGKTALKSPFGGQAAHFQLKNSGKNRAVGEMAGEDGVSVRKIKFKNAIAAGIMGGARSARGGDRFAQVHGASRRFGSNRFPGCGPGSTCTTLKSRLYHGR